MSAAMEAMRTGMDICPDEYRGDMTLKAVWLACFMRGYRYKQEEPPELNAGNEASGGSAASPCGYSLYVLGGPNDEQCIKPLGHAGAHLFPGTS